MGTFDVSEFEVGPRRINIQPIPKPRIQRSVTTIHTMGKKEYELTNHLGNVLVTVSDKKIPHSTNTTTVDYYNANVLSAYDYYAFGMIKPNAKNLAGDYRFGFNGKEEDNEMKGMGNSLDFGDRIYDSRLGRWLSLDKDVARYPDQSPFSYSMNNPLYFVDPVGRGAKSTITGEKDAVTGLTIIRVTANIIIHNDNIKDLSCIASDIESNIENMWNNPVKVNSDGTTETTVATTRYNTKDYRIVFDVNVEIVSDAEAERREQEIDNSPDKTIKQIDDNFIKVEESFGFSNMTGGHSGTWYTGQQSETGNTYASEFGHILGWTDKEMGNGEKITDNDAHAQPTEPLYPLSIMSSPTYDYLNRAKGKDENFDLKSRIVRTEDIANINFGLGVGFKNKVSLAYGVISRGYGPPSKVQVAKWGETHKSTGDNRDAEKSKDSGKNPKKDSNNSKSSSGF